MRPLISVFVLGLLVALAQVQAADEAPKPAIVFTSVLKTAELYDELSYPTRVMSKVNTTVLAETDGVVSKVYALLGKSVRRKEKVVQITNTDPVYQYAPVTLTSPISGVVSSVEVTEGTQVSRGQRLATITDPSRLRLEAEVPSPDLPFVQPGTPGELHVENHKAPLAVRVTGVSPFVDPATGTASAQLELVEPSQLLRPGQVGQLTFKAGARQGIQVPDFAVVYKGAGTFVRLLENGKAKQVTVTLGHKQRGRVELLSGVNAEAVLIERASRFVADGEDVVVQEGAK